MSGEPSESPGSANCDRHTVNIYDGGVLGGGEVHLLPGERRSNERVPHLGRDVED